MCKFSRLHELYSVAEFAGPMPATEIDRFRSLNRVKYLIRREHQAIHSVRYHGEGCIRLNESNLVWLRERLEALRAMRCRKDKDERTCRFSEHWPVAEWRLGGPLPAGYATRCEHVERVRDAIGRKRAWLAIYHSIPALHGQLPLDFFDRVVELAWLERRLGKLLG